MNYVARMILTKDLAAKQKLFGVYDWHKAAWELFPDMPNADREFLFRLDESEEEFQLTVASKHKPRHSPWCPEDDWLCYQIPPEYFNRQQYLFMLRVNPTRTTRKNLDETRREKKHGRHEAVLKMPELREWFIKKSGQCGFRALDQPKLDISPPVFHRLEKDGYNGTIIGVDFKGALEVTNRELFKTAFENGIGRARSFGFGLLILKPIQ